MNPAPPVTRIGESTMTVVMLQQARQSRTPGTRLDTEGIEDFLAGQHAVLRLICRIVTIGVGDRHQAVEAQLTMLTSLGIKRLSHDQRRRCLLPAVVIGAPERSLAIELLDDGQHDPRRIIHRRRVATSVISQRHLLTPFESLQEAPKQTVLAVIE